MYSAILLTLLAISAALVAFGVRRRRYALAGAGVVLVLLTGAFFGLLSFWGEMLWFDALDFQGRFWTLVWVRLAAAAVAAALGALILAVLTPVPRPWRIGRAGFAVLGGLIGLTWGLNSWETIFLFVHRVSVGIADPIFGRDVGFYLFTLPFLDAVYSLLILLAVLALGGGGALYALQAFSVATGMRLEPSSQDRDRAFRGLCLAAAVVLFVLAGGWFLDRYHLLYSRNGTVTGAGWTDVKVRLPALWTVAVASLLLGAVLAAIPRVGALRRFADRTLRVNRLEPRFALLAPPLGAFVLLGLLWFVALGLLPGLLQWLRVQPNELDLERPYIVNNIAFTRLAFGLDGVEDREYPVVETFSPQAVAANPAIFDNIRLWDYRALADVYSQFQEIRLYYEFADVDVDRYTINGQYRQVMVSARELEQANLPPRSQTFVNRHFKYTHGYGITLATVRDFTPEGLPNLLVKDIPPQSAYPSLEVQVPQIYYGELTRDYVVGNTASPEFDYPRRDDNVYIHYPGTGGVRMDTLWRRFVYGWMLGGTRLLLSEAPREGSRILFRRQIRQRAQALAPFLAFDDDPYVVLSQGRLFWILDAYTTSSRFPYSEPFLREGEGEYPPGRGWGFADGPEDLRGVNYVRNSVKVVIDAFNGDVAFYLVDPEDPIVRAWAQGLPGMFRPLSEMPPDLLAHIRYPADMLLVQGLVYAKYHMTDPTVFYNQEDLWVRATEKYYQNVQPVQPYYIIWELPESNAPEFVLMLPFTPKNKQVLIGWIAGMCDGANYGRLLAYKFPKDKRVVGPQQVESKIDQDPELSSQLTLWDQRGSSVLRGNVLAIPVAQTIFYVEPIYLRAETAAYPELRLVVVMYDDRLAYAPTLEGALDRLFGREPDRPITERPPFEGAPPDRGTSALIRAANQAFDQYLQQLGDRQYEQAGRSLQELEDALRQLSERQGGGGRPTTAPVRQPGQQ